MLCWNELNDTSLFHTHIRGCISKIEWLLVAVPMQEIELEQSRRDGTRGGKEVDIEGTTTWLPWLGPRFIKISEEPCVGRLRWTEDTYRRTAMQLLV